MLTATSRHRPRTSTPARKRAPAHGDEPRGLTLTIDPSRLSRAGLLELMRAGLGLSYTDLATRSGIGADRVMQILRGRCHDALPGDLRLLRDQLWDALPYRPPSPAIGAIAEGPAFLSIAQVARFLSLAPATVRCLASAEKSLGAIKIGRFVRIPRASLLSFLEQRCGLARPRRGSSVTLRQAAETLGVTTAVIRHAVRLGRIRTLHGGRHQRPRISGRELERVMRAGTQPLPEVRPRVRRAKHAPALS